MTRYHDTAAKRAKRVTEPVQVYLAQPDRARLDWLTRELQCTKSDVLRRALESLEHQIANPATHPALQIITSPMPRSAQSLGLMSRASTIATWPRSKTLASSHRRPLTSLPGRGRNVPRELFVDASAWYPIAVISHPDHARLAAALTERVRRGMRIVTTNLVVAESHALLVNRAGHDPAVRFLRSARAHPNVVVSSTPELELRALVDWIAPYDDHAFTLADAVSFTVMTERRIRDALTLDRHFAVAGFTMVPLGTAA